MKTRLFFTLVIVLASFLIPTNQHKPASDGNEIHFIEPVKGIVQTPVQQIATVAPVPISPEEYVRAEAAKYGWSSGAEWAALHILISNESGWRPYIYNSSSGACGLFQALPCEKLGAPLENISNQARWGLAYISGRYGSPSSALALWKSRYPHWY